MLYYIEYHDDCSKSGIIEIYSNQKEFNDRAKEFKETKCYTTAFDYGERITPVWPTNYIRNFVKHP